MCKLIISYDYRFIIFSSIYRMFKTYHEPLGSESSLFLRLNNFLIVTSPARGRFATHWEKDKFLQGNDASHEQYHIHVRSVWWLIGRCNTKTPVLLQPFSSGKRTVGWHGMKSMHSFQRHNPHYRWTRDRVIEQANHWAQWSARAKQAVRSKRMREQMTEYSARVDC